MYHIEFRKACIALYEYFGSLRQVSRILKVSIATLSRWLHRLEPSKRSTNPRKTTDALIEIIRCFMTVHPTANCPLVVKHIREILGISISRQLVYLILTKRLGLSYKRTRKRGRSSRKDTYDFATFFARFREAFDSKTLVAIDESGFDQRSTPIYAYSPRGFPAIVEWKTCSDHRHYNLLMSTHQCGGHEEMLYVTSIDGATFAEYLQNLDYPSGTTFLLDNASIHKTRKVREVALAKGYDLLYTLPYSPEFNPIELVFGVIKSHFYRERYTRDFTLIEAIEKSVQSKSKPATIRGCFEHVLELIEKLRV